MQKRFNIILWSMILFAGFSFSMSGETVSQKQARIMAEQFFNEAAGRVVGPVKMIYNGRRLTTDRLFTPFYVFNNPTGGFVIISAENKTFPILGFSLKDSFDPERIGDSEKALLKSYAREIELIRYDTDTPEKAIKAWIDYPDYVVEVLKAAYDATDPTLSIPETMDILYNAVEPESNDAVFSDIYTPSQWQDMINDELRARSNVAVGVIDNNVIEPIIIHGRHGDYYRMEMSRRNDWLMRLNASELISANMITVVGNPLLIEEEIAEEIPFSIVDDFNQETSEIEARRLSEPSPYLNLISDKPLVRHLGSGHYEIILPENVALATVYNLGGSPVLQRTFRNSTSAFLDLSAEPFGFYFVRLIGESGQPYGLKIYR